MRIGLLIHGCDLIDSYVYRAAVLVMQMKDPFVYLGYFPAKRAARAAAYIDRFSYQTG